MGLIFRIARYCMRQCMDNSREGVALKERCGQVIASAAEKCLADLKSLLARSSRHALYTSAQNCGSPGLDTCTEKVVRSSLFPTGKCTRRNNAGKHSSCNGMAI